MKTLSFKDYIQIKRPKYIYIRITSHKSVRNYNSTNIAKTIATSFRALNKRMYKLSKKIIIETNFKISYLIDIKNNNAEFYFIIPEFFKTQLLGKINEIWSKATVEEVEKIEEPLKDFVYEVKTKKEDALSIAYDKKSNEPLNTILASMDYMKEEDRISILFNFTPRSQFGWIDTYNSTMEKVKKKEPLEKPSLKPSYLFKKGFLGAISFLDTIFGVLTDFAGVEKVDTKESLYSAILGVMEEQKELSNNTKKKRDSLILPAEIVVTGNKEEMVLDTCQSFRVLDEDNEMVCEQIKKPNFNLESYSTGATQSIFSVDEVSNFLKIPGRLLLLQHKINHINIEENPIPKQLLEGTKRLGVATYKGNKINTFLDTEWNSANTCLTCVGGQGSGKTTFICNYAKDCIKANESLFVLDFIKNCELSEDIEAIAPTDRVVKINLAEEESSQAFAYNELKITEDMSDYKKLDMASMQSEQLMTLIDSISLGDPLSSSMRRIFNAACILSSIHNQSSLKDVVDCLERHQTRSYLINYLSEELQDLLEDEINTLKELNEYNKNGELIGTKMTKISFILDRINLLRSNFKLKYMYKANPKNNIDLKELLDQNKIILIQMREGDFPTKLQKNILVTYWITKLWLATQLRGMEQDKPNRVNVIIDEVFQAPTSLELLKDILVQARKFALKPILSIHYVSQVASIFEALLTSNGSFMLLKGATEQDYNYLKNKIENLEYEDLKDMQKYHSLNVICHSEGYDSFITKLPPK